MHPCSVTTCLALGHVQVGKQGEPWDAEHLCNLAFNFMHHEKAFGLLAPQTSGGGPDEQYGRLLRLVRSKHMMATCPHDAAAWDPGGLVPGSVVPA